MFLSPDQGAYFAWKATAMGKNYVNGKTFLEKRQAAQDQISGQTDLKNFRTLEMINFMDLTDWLYHSVFEFSQK